ncbi:MAG: hypothetical protein H0U98_05190 [Alphaproteobacteria bacterium]|nr:hypothetical protein [Alphaproteobacteria bacterium]
MPRYWFRQKTFGYGATPNTWQGWLLTIASLALLFAVVLLGPAIRDNALRVLWMVLGIAITLGVYTFIAWRKTEGGWQWRSGSDD